MTSQCAKCLRLSEPLPQKIQKRGKKKKKIDDNQLELFGSNEQYIKKT